MRAQNVNLQRWLCDRWANRQDHPTVRLVMDFITKYMSLTNNLCSEFAESTILTIAHRLRTVIDYDRVSVLTIFWNHAWLLRIEYNNRWWYLSRAELLSLIGICKAFFVLMMRKLINYSGLPPCWKTQPLNSFHCAEQREKKSLQCWKKWREFRW